MEGIQAPGVLISTSLDLGFLDRPVSPECNQVKLCPS